MTAQRELTDSEHEWLDVRDHLRENRYELAVAAADDYPDIPKVAGTPLLTAPGWIPERPIPLDQIDLHLDHDARFDGVRGTEDVATSALPVHSDGSRYASYADAVSALAAPAVLENRPTYRLMKADLTGPKPKLAFERGNYFDSINTGEAAAHEYASARISHSETTSLRGAIGDPCDPLRRPTNVAISTVTIRHDRTDGSATFLLHWRDPAKVAHAGGLYQVVPVGIFQPSGEADWNEPNDFSLWRNIVREMAEEVLGESEDHDSEHSPIDYSTWPFAAKLTNARTSGGVHTYCLGLGVDPLTFATDLLTAVVIDAPLFDDVLGELATDNAEGRVLDAQPFTADRIDELVSKYPFQAAGAALLQLAARVDLL